MGPDGGVSHLRSPSLRRESQGSLIYPWADAQGSAKKGAAHAAGGSSGIDRLDGSNTCTFAG